MYFKKLEVFGFKSFAEKAELQFEPGVTAVVGPNGCGKTNISDSIRWVLGEQSAKQLRGVKMEDVIFNGSRSRQAVGMAEVSLTLDNSQNVLPVDYSEITVTRRLFRSGESEYLLNKVPCRHKDISELFMDTGIDAYSLLENKQIEMILNSKPEDRRFLFEEAAGVMKYKVRKNEAMHKLEQTAQNLLRLGDVINEVKSRIGSLDYQARKARQYQKYQEELKALELNSLYYSWSQLRQQSDQFTTLEMGFNQSQEKINGRDVLRIHYAYVDPNSQNTLPVVVEGVEYIYLSQPNALIIAMEDETSQFSSALPDFVRFLGTVNYPAGGNQ